MILTEEYRLTNKRIGLKEEGKEHKLTNKIIGLKGEEKMWINGELRQKLNDGQIKQNRRKEGRIKCKLMNQGENRNKNNFPTHDLCIMMSRGSDLEQEQR